MADYIDKNILCQAYIHVELPDGLTEQQLQEIKNHLMNYANLRAQFFDYLHTDVKRLADSMVAESLFSTKARHQHVLRTEARTGVVGSLKCLIDDLNILEGSLGQISVDEAARRIKKIKDDADVLLVNVRSDEDMKSIQNELDDFSDHLPDRCPHPPEKSPNDSAIVAYYDSLSELRKHYGKLKKGSAGVPPRRPK
jgi:hypothetical protein